MISTCLCGLRERGGGGISTRGLTTVIGKMTYRSYARLLRGAGEGGGGGGRRERKKIVTVKKEKKGKSGDKKRKMRSEFGRVL
jgi:hypothetical protein